jgi:hypothetical protein
MFGSVKKAAVVGRVALETKKQPPRTTQITP